MSSSTSRGTDLALREGSTVYVAPNGELHLDVQIDSETVWLTQAQIADLFDVTRQNINLHIGNVYQEGELDRQGTCKDFLQVRKEGRRTVRRHVEHYSLDAIISVGYRVNSKTATAFRQWATGVLRERLINAHRQRQVEQARWQALGGIVSHVEDRDEARALLDVVGRYTNSWRILREYDENRLPDRPTAPTTKKLKRLTLKQARAAIVSLKNDQVRRGDAGALFGIERDKSLEGILGNIEQTFDGHALYPSVEERAAALLYFVIKDHPFSDGNKRIGSLLFLHYLDKNACLTRPDGTRRFDDNALVAIALLVASSDPKQKDLVTRLILAMLS
jgi:prophage maintenance system killer protein